MNMLRFFAVCRRDIESHPSPRPRWLGLGLGMEQDVNSRCEFTHLLLLMRVCLSAAGGMDKPSFSDLNGGAGHEIKKG